MSKYKSATIEVAKSATEISDKFADLTQLQPVIDRPPAEERAKIGDINFTTDTISVTTKQVGAVSFRVVERKPSEIVMAANGTPMPLQFFIKLDEKAPTATDVTCTIDIDIPMMLRPMVGPQIQKAADMLGSMIGKMLG